MGSIKRKDGQGSSRVSGSRATDCYTVLFPPINVDSASSQGSGPRAPPRNKMALYDQVVNPLSRKAPASTAVSSCWTFPSESGFLGSSVQADDDNVNEHFSYQRYSSYRQQAEKRQRESSRTGDNSSISVNEGHSVNLARDVGASTRRAMTVPQENNKAVAAARNYMRWDTGKTATSGILDPRNALQYQESGWKDLSVGRVEPAKERPESFYTVDLGGCLQGNRHTNEGFSLGGIVQQAQPCSPGVFRSLKENESEAERKDRESERPGGLEAASARNWSALLPKNMVMKVGRQEFWNMRKAILRQELIFRSQVFELHRVSRVQCVLMHLEGSMQLEGSRLPWEATPGPSMPLKDGARRDGFQGGGLAVKERKDEYSQGRAQVQNTSLVGPPALSGPPAPLPGFQSSWNPHSHVLCHVPPTMSATASPLASSSAAAVAFQNPYPYLDPYSLLLRPMGQAYAPASVAGVDGMGMRVSPAALHLGGGPHLPLTLPAAWQHYQQQHQQAALGGLGPAEQSRFTPVAIPIPVPVPVPMDLHAGPTQPAAWLPHPLWGSVPACAPPEPAASAAHSPWTMAPYALPPPGAGAGVGVGEAWAAAASSKASAGEGEQSGWSGAVAGYRRSLAERRAEQKKRVRGRQRMAGSSGVDVSSCSSWMSAGALGRELEDCEARGAEAEAEAAAGAGWVVDAERFHPRGSLVRAVPRAMPLTSVAAAHIWESLRQSGGGGDST